jgi:uncharacterized protein (DUF362 family)
MADRQNNLDRRSVLKVIGLGTLGLAAGQKTFAPTIARAGAGGITSPRRRLFQKATETAKVALVKGSDRRDIVYRALKNIEDQIVPAIGNKKILIKCNFVTGNRQLAATEVDAVRAILDFLKPHYTRQITIGESLAFNGPTPVAFMNYGFLPLEKEYNVRLVDLNTTPWQYRYVFGRGHKPIPIRIISTFLDPDLFIISAAKMKTHDRVVTTLSIKNVILGAPLNDYKNNDKWLTHSVYNFSREAVLHFNMFHLAQEIYPDLGVIDGFVAMEGNGPVGGTPVDARIALASMDPLAMDTLATSLMGFDPAKIMYLTAMNEAGFGQGDLDKIQVLGTPVDQCRYKFKMHERLVEPYGA